MAGQVRAMPDEKLRDTRRDLRAGLGLMRRVTPAPPGSLRRGGDSVVLR
jgi:hypothetical protein